MFDLLLLEIVVKCTGFYVSFSTVSLAGVCQSLGCGAHHHMSDCLISPDDLDGSIQNLKELLSIDESKRTASQAAEFYLSSVRLIIALKADNHAIRTNSSR